MLSLSPEVSDQIADDQLVAQSLEGDQFSGAYLKQRIAEWRRQGESQQSRCVAVYHSNAVEFLAILISVWEQRKVAVIPANKLERMVRSVAQLTTDFLGEIDIGDQTAGPGRTVNTADLQPDTALIIYTSGSSDEPVAISKTFAQLNGELQTLQKAFASQVAGTLTVGTVSHHHMFGLPFRVFWPFVARRPFLQRELVYLEQLQALPAQDISLISSPAHLEHLPETISWEPIARHIRSVFSAGSQLPAEAADQITECMGVAVTDIYGSSETGAVAFRNPANMESWQPLPGTWVQVKEDRLAVRSPGTEDNWFISEDRGEVFPDNRFALSGRADKVIKVGAKRISITAIENQLLTHPWVVAAKVLLLPERKSRVGAVIKLTAQGAEQLVDLGNRSVSQELVTVLQGVVEQVAWPRYWRFVAAMPRNSQGKITGEVLEPLFSAADRVDFPELMEHPDDQDEDPSSRLLRFVVPANLSWLQGHFPAQPILPGVVQIGWAMHYGEQLFDISGHFLRLEVIKFQHVIRPNEAVDLKLTWESAKNRLTFQYFKADKIYSSGKIAFRVER